MQVIEGGEPVVVPNQEGKNTTPSVVAFQKDGSVLVGDTAKRSVLVPWQSAVAVAAKQAMLHGNLLLPTWQSYELARPSKLCPNCSVFATEVAPPSSLPPSKNCPPPPFSTTGRLR